MLQPGRILRRRPLTRRCARNLLLASRIRDNLLHRLTAKAFYPHLRARVLSKTSAASIGASDDCANRPWHWFYCNLPPCQISASLTSQFPLPPCTLHPSKCIINHDTRPVLGVGSKDTRYKTVQTALARVSATNAEQPSTRPTNAARASVR